MKCSIFKTHILKNKYGRIKWSKSVILVLRRQKLVDSWSLLARQPRLCCKFQARERPSLKKTAVRVGWGSEKV